MYKVVIYEDKNGRSTIKDYIYELEKNAQTNKDSRVQLKKILEFFAIISKYGTRAGRPIVKHIAGDIWELRPMSNRIFFFFWKDDIFVMLHHFIKKTKKTPVQFLC